MFIANITKFIGFVSSLVTLMTLFVNAATAASLQGVVLDDNTDSAVPDVRVVLTDVFDVDNVTIVRTNAMGVFLFTEVPAGEYDLQVFEPNGYIPVFSTAGDKGSAIQPQAVVGIELTSTDQVSEYVFDIVVDPFLSIIRGTVFSDENNNGIREPGEFGIPYVEISLENEELEFFTTTQTDDDGRYQLLADASFSFTLRESQPLGWQDGMESPLLGDAEVSVGPDRYDNLFLSGGSIVDGLTFGERGLFTLANLTWELISVPVIPPQLENTVDAIFGDDIPGQYGKDWIMYAYDANLNNYVQPSAESEIEIGRGYWIIQATGSDVQLQWPTGSTPVTPEFHSACAAADQRCVKLDISVPDEDATWQLLGHSYIHATNNADIRITSNGALCNEGCTLEEARTANLIEREFFEYKNSVYNNLDTADQVIPWTGLWLETLSAARNATISLLVPPPQ